MAKENRQHFGSALVPLSRVILGLVLVVSTLWTNIPLVEDVSGPMCDLVCCVGRAPHAAGSCMNSSCHAFPTGGNDRVHTHHEEPDEVEELCGLTGLTMNASWLSLVETVTTDPGSGAHSDLSQSTSTSTSDKAGVSAAVVTKPCQLDCGSCASGFTNSNRKRNSSALAYADRPRPPSRGELVDVAYQATRKLRGLSRRGVPRGPPLPLAFS